MFLAWEAHSGLRRVCGYINKKDKYDLKELQSYICKHLHTLTETSPPTCTGACSITAGESKFK